MNEYETVSKSVKTDIIDGLKDRLPQIFEDGKINLEKLKALLTGEIVEKEDDRFYFNWAGKSKLFKLIQEPGYGTLKPDKERSIDFDNTENIVIVGENLETLKLLLKTYFGKVKMIYIDPPYNTGNDFIYRDNFKEPLKDYLEKTGQIDTEGSKLTTNTEASGRYHSDWLNFMYPRLFLARSLLRDDGVIFVSIDDNEVHNLRKLCDEVYGEENFISELVVIRSEGGGLAKQVVKGHDYLLIYAKNINQFSPLKKPKDIRGKIIEKESKKYWIEEDWLRKEFGKYGTCPYDQIEKYHGKEKKKEIDEGVSKGVYQLVKKNKGEVIVGRLRNIEADGSKFYSVLKHLNADGVKDLEKLKLQDVFSFPKPVSLLKELIQGATFFTKNENEIILDFLAGSGTTGDAVWNLNREDGGNRKFILVNLDEEVQNENIKKEFPTVADICIERLKRVSEKYKKEERGKLIESKQDLGFKVFRLDKSNFNLKDEFEISEGEDAEELKKRYLDWLGLWINEPLVGEWKPIDIAFEMMLKEGFDLNSKIEEMKIKGNKFFHVVDEKQKLGFYMSLDEKISEEAIEEIRTPEYRDKVFVFLDKALSDNDKINLSAFVRLKVI